MPHTILGCIVQASPPDGSEPTRKERLLQCPGVQKSAKEVVTPRSTLRHGGRVEIHRAGLATWMHAGFLVLWLRACYGFAHRPSACCGVCGSPKVQSPSTQQGNGGHSKHPGQDAGIGAWQRVLHDSVAPSSS